MKKDEKNIFDYFVKMLLIFTSIDIVLMITSNIVASTSLFAKYGVELITEIFYAFAILIVMLLFHNSYVFTEKKKKFWPSICLGTPLLVISIINFVTNISNLNSVSISNLINVFILCVFVGIAEEFLCRGWLQNEFIERFSDSKKSVIASIILSSLIFGVMHIVNLSSQTLFETVLQIINATSLGILLGSIYYKTKNIWSVIFLHSFYDFAIFISEVNLVKDCTYNTPSTGVALVNCIMVLFISALWIFGALKVLNSISFNGGRTSKKKDKIYTIMVLICFAIVFFPFEALVSDYDEYQTCYNYNEIGKLNDYEEHFPYYTINYIRTNIEVENLDELNAAKENESIAITFIANDDALSIKNAITLYESIVDIPNINGIQLLENDECYMLLIESLENETTIYYSKIYKSELRNDDAFIDNISKSFKKYYLPSIDRMGYVTFKGSSIKYPYFISSNNDKFIIRNEDLYLIK